MGTLSLVFGRDNEDGLWVKVTKPVQINSQTVMGDDARIEARGLTGKRPEGAQYQHVDITFPGSPVLWTGAYNQKLEYPVSSNEPRYELQQQQTLVLLRVIWRKT